MLTVGNSAVHLPRVAGGASSLGLLLLALLALAASLRGWGLWPVAMVALWFAPVLPRVSFGGELMGPAVLMSSALPWLSLVGLALMTAIGRDRPA
jgi:hypothetical protein